VKQAVKECTVSGIQRNTKTQENIQQNSTKTTKRPDGLF
jgi:hypothetical protein